MRVLITGTNGFVGKNLAAHLAERKDVEVLSFSRDNALDELPALVAEVDFIFHLAGVNRPQDLQEFRQGNTDLTQALCDAIALGNKPVSLLYTSSIQAELDNAYGASKLGAEQALLNLAASRHVSVNIFRLPNVFGKWSKPNYNSAVATFCHNIARDLPIRIDNPDAEISLVYIDDVVRYFVDVMDGKSKGDPFISVEPQYQLTVGQLAEQIHAFRDSRKTLVSEPVGTGLVRALYSTYLSFLPPERFTYEVPIHADPRGAFVEMLKTRDSGQFSFFTAHPGVTRGGHYHHSKTEKFLVIKGKACFRFRHIVSGEHHELFTQGGKAEIVETVPGWTHDITNVGDDELIVMLWANEIFDREHPDTYACPVLTQA